MVKVFVLILFLMLFISCSKLTDDPGESYIYISHPRINSNDGIYDKVYNIDFSSYDMILLGVI